MFMVGTMQLGTPLADSFFLRSNNNLLAKLEFRLQLVPQILLPPLPFPVREESCGNGGILAHPPGARRDCSSYVWLHILSLHRNVWC